MPPTPISFARGAPAPELVPAAELAECAYAVARREASTLFAYGPGGGYAPLREWVAARHGVDARRVVLTVGGLQGFAFYAAEQLERRPGRVLVEAPSYDRPLKILARERAEIVALPMDDEGLDPDALEAELRRGSEPPSFLYTIPTFQNPSGRSLSTERRRRIVEIVVAHRLAVLEDDPYGLLRFAGEGLPRLFELAGGDEAVMFMSSFSKTVAPGIRVGYALLPEELMGEMQTFVFENYVSPVMFVEATLHEFVSRGRFDPNVEAIQEALHARRDAMIAALAREMPEGTSWNEPDGGYFLWVDLPDELSAASLLAQADEVGVAFIKGPDFFFHGGGQSALRLAFSYERPEAIDEGITRLGGLVRDGLAVHA